MSPFIGCVCLQYFNSSYRCGDSLLCVPDLFIIIIIFLMIKTAAACFKFMIKTQSFSQITRGSSRCSHCQGRRRDTSSVCHPTKYCE